jgi:hypothetical protein
MTQRHNRGLPGLGIARRTARARLARERLSRPKMTTQPGHQAQDGIADIAHGEACGDYYAGRVSGNMDNRRKHAGLPSRHA